MLELAARFAAWGVARHTALVPYITAGFPAPDATVDLMRRFARAGADIIELGVPFSDPVADGPTIQRASQIALDQGASLAWTLEQLRLFRATHDTPVVIFSYLNPVFNYGAASFVEDATTAGADGVLLTDLPLDGDPALESLLEAAPPALIRMIAPSTSTERAKAIAARAQGFLYYVARMGVTGARAQLDTGLYERLAELRAFSPVPVCVGFGVSTPEQAAAIGQSADGVVVGSALIDAIDEGGPDAAETLLSTLRSALP